MNTIDIDIRREKDGGWSGGLVKKDEHGSLSFTSGNSFGYFDRRYAHVDYLFLHITADRDAFDGLTKDSPLEDWYKKALALAVEKITTEELIDMLKSVHLNGVKEGKREARREMRKALGL